MGDAPVEQHEMTMAQPVSRGIIGFVKGHVFIHHPGALGDLLLSLPSLWKLKAVYGKVHVACRPDLVETVKDFGIADEASSVESGVYSSLYNGLPDESAKAFFCLFDAAYIFSVRADSPLNRGIRMVVTDCIAVITIPQDGLKVHVSEFRTNQVPGSADFSGLVIPPDLKVRAKEILGLKGIPEREAFIAIHYGSGGSRKCWPIENYLKLAEKFAAGHGVSIVFISGPAEGEREMDAVDSFVSSTSYAVHITDAAVTEVAALLSASRVYIGNDSGVSHLAGAVNCRSVVLFGPTDPVLWRPLGNKVVVITPSGGTGDITGISVLEVLEMVSSLMGVQSIPLHRG